MTLTFDLLTLKVVSESRVTWATFVPILVFLGLSVLDNVRDRQTSDVHHRLMPRILRAGHNNNNNNATSLACRKRSFKDRLQNIVH